MRNITALICLLFLLSACSINRIAMNLVADALTGDGSADVFTSDSDPQLVGDAIPFAIKMYEALLSQNPNHQGLINTTGSMFVMYANAYVQGPAEMLPQYRFLERQMAMDRAKNLYLRGLELLYRGLELKYPGFSAASAEGRLPVILARMKKADVPALYWSSAAGLSAYSIDLLDFELSARIPEWNAMIHRAYELDPDFGGYSLDEFLIIFYASLPEVMGGDIEKAKVHFQRAVEKSRGNSTGAYVSYAEFISVPAQDYDTFKDYLEKALAIDPDIDKSARLVNIITQRRARWLLDNAWLYFSFLPIPDDY
ncbi:MAG: TRAP transporter TatT component family protein [Treponema sp.]|nr:TRAP transporter TatT component family protein [Treponema sp.]